MPSEDYERLFVTNLPLIERLSRFFCRESGLTAADVEDFVASVGVHLLDNDYAVLRQFEGRCTFSTYLSLVIQRLLFDYRVQHWGRFRPSTAAQRLGPAATQLELLLRRDGLPLNEAVARLESRGESMSLAEAERIAAQLPPRRPRVTTVAVDSATPAELAVDAATVEEAAAATERRATSETVAAVMRDAMATLSAEDRAILRLHFVAGLSVADIARSMGLIQRQTYRRIHRIYDALRARLRAGGVHDREVTELLGRADVDLEFGLREVPR
ncbi:MAG TPA: sigma-70 family RNA polymerase sigma factor [Thermoanaerobaculia bacterium]